MRIPGFAAGLCAFAVLSSPAAHAGACPPLLATAVRLVVVTADDMHGNRGWMSLYGRTPSGKAWQKVGGSEPILVGQNGLAWGPGFQNLAQPGEPRKRESDWRTPIGIYRIGAPFGFASSRLANYVRIVPGQTFCVDDPKSSAYNTITTVQRAGTAVSDERMWEYPQYRNGLFIRYPSTRAHPADSCVFIHVATSPDELTAGCLALPEQRVIALQRFAAGGAVIATVTRETRARFADCLPAD